MKNSIWTNLAFIVLPVLAFLLGCSNDPSGDAAMNPTEDIIAKWTVDDDATRKGWGDRSSKLEKMMVDEMGMSIEFKNDNVVTYTKNGRSGDGYWEIKNSTADSLEIIVASSKDAEKKVQIKITFQGKDQFLFQSSEMEFEEDLIFKKVAQ